MNRRFFISALSMLPFAGLARPAYAKKSLQELSAYLNKLTTAKGDFTQYNPNGSKSKGVFMMRRPRRMRFEYSGNNKNLVIASAGNVAVFDGRSNAGPKTYPTNRTPLHLILARQVDLTKNKMVFKHEGDGKTTTISARDPKNPEYGSVKMTFQNNPLTLSGWVVTDQSGRKTKVQLRKLHIGLKLPGSLFDYQAEAKKRKAG